MEPSHLIGPKQVSHIDRLLDDFCSQLLDRARRDVGGWEADYNHFTFSDELGRIAVHLQPESSGAVSISVTEMRGSGERVSYTKPFASVEQVVLGEDGHALCKLANSAMDGLGMRDAAIEITKRCRESMRRLADLPGVVMDGGPRECTISSLGNGRGLEITFNDSFRCNIRSMTRRAGSTHWRAEMEAYYPDGSQTPAVPGVERGVVDRLFVFTPSVEGQAVNDMAQTLWKLYRSHAC